MRPTTPMPVQRVFLTLIRLAAFHVIYLLPFCLSSVFVFHIDVTVSTDVLERVSLLYALFTPLNFPQSRRYRVSLLLHIPPASFRFTVTKVALC